MLDFRTLQLQNPECDSNQEWSVACLCLWKRKGWESFAVYLSVGKITRTAFEELGTVFPSKLPGTKNILAIGQK